MTQVVSQEEINEVLWQACDTFRGALDPTQYKDYILVMLFIKYMSDMWKDKREQFHQQYKGDEKRVERALARERFVMPVVELRDRQGAVEESFLASFDSLYERRTRSNIGELINIALEAIEDANKAKLDNVFRNIDFSSEPNLGQTKDRNRRLNHLLEDFAKPQLNLRPSRIGIGHAGRLDGEQVLLPRLPEFLAQLAHLLEVGDDLLVLFRDVGQQQGEVGTDNRQPREAFDPGLTELGTLI